ncbi:hypothetical protein [Variovorax sp. OV329]|uniref:hypothetical protein n=1 Tax=Variovorax sp. OV329 TaxID=1882825 RepID=UPI0008F43F05|nr:hypothetical protein [Variovorax sp. OV329]SFL96775.1 hypothetical protein SAMN05444747_101505 [Variovorax sp. OV329]
MEKEHDTNLGWWTDKPEREDRDTSFAPMSGPLNERQEPVWLKAAVIVTIMVVFGLSLLRLVGLIP